MVKKITTILLFALFAIFLSGCATTQKKIYPSVTNFIGSSDFIKYKRIAVLPFSDAPYSPQSGQIVQGLASQILAQAGFDVVERTRLIDILKEQKMSASGLFDTSQQIELGKLLGVKAIAVGEVGQYMTQQRKTDTTYFPWTNWYTGQTTYIPIQGQQWMESYVSLSLRILDVETGTLVYSGSGQYNQGLTNPPQQLAEYILGEIIMKWIISPGMCGFATDPMDHTVVRKVFSNSPAEKAGLKKEDKILKINNRNVSKNLSPFEWSSITWGKPGEKMILEVERNSENLKFEIIRDYREKIFK